MKRNPRLLKSLILLSVLLLCAKGISADEATQKTTATVDSSNQIARQIVESEIPVLVDFWAAWCPPCKYLDPIIEELEEEYKDRVLFIKVDVDRHKSLSAHFGVNVIPTIFLVDNSNVLSSIPGVRPKEHYAEKLDEIILNRQQSEKQ